MTDSSTSTAVVAFDAAFADPRRLALAGFLASYSGQTGDAYTLDLRQFVAWCELRGLDLFEVRRVDIETFGRDLETAGRARATVVRRLCTVAGVYRYAEEEALLAHSPCTCDVLASTGSLMSSPWTGTRSGPCWSPPD